MRKLRLVALLRMRWKFGIESIVKEADAAVIVMTLLLGFISYSKLKLMGSYCCGAGCRAWTDDLRVS